MLGIKRIDHVSVVHGDLEGRIRFYQDLFGMEVVERFETESGAFKGVAMTVSQPFQAGRGAPTMAVSREGPPRLESLGYGGPR